MGVLQSFGNGKGLHREVRLPFPPEPTRDRRASPKGHYVYAIQVDGVVRYIGKGTSGRMFAHMKEVRQRLTRAFKLKNISPPFQQKLTEAVVRGAAVLEVVLADDLTSEQAYKLEYRYFENFVHEGKRRQLWNVIPPSIYTPQEYEAYVNKLTQIASSRSRLARALARSQLARLGQRSETAGTTC